MLIQKKKRSVTYTNTSDNPSGLTRSIEFFATDASAGTSLSASRDITVAPVNDPPVVTNTVADLAYTENDGAVAVDTGALGVRAGELTIAVRHGVAEVQTAGSHLPVPLASAP